MSRVVLGLAAALAVFLLAAGTAWRQSVGGLDHAVMKWVVARRDELPAITAYCRVITELGGPPLTYGLLLGAAMVLGGLATRGFVRLGRRDLAYWLAVALGGQGLSQALKALCRRERPPECLRLVTVTSFSFPSGHSLFAAAFFGVVALACLHIARTEGKTPPWRLAVAGGCGLLAVQVAASRIWLGVHYPTDVLGGLALGTALALASWSHWWGRRGAA